jgi:hypothetical protein
MSHSTSETPSLTVGLLPRFRVLKRPNFMNDAGSVTLED